LLARYSFARDVMGVREGGGRFKPEKLMDLEQTAAPDLVDAALEIPRRHGSVLDGGEGMRSSTTSAERAHTSTSSTTSIFRNMKLGGLFALIVGGPVYQTH
jgi:hypothetical protein